jgi:hypothetical protein
MEVGYVPKTCLVRAANYCKNTVAQSGTFYHDMDEAVHLTTLQPSPVEIAEPMKKLLGQYRVLRHCNEHDSRPIYSVMTRQMCSPWRQTGST